MLLKDKMEFGWKTIIFWVFTEKSVFKGGGGSRKTNIEGGNCLKRGAWTVSRFEEGRLGKINGGGVFFFDIPMHTMVEYFLPEKLPENNSV